MLKSKKTKLIFTTLAVLFFIGTAASIIAVNLSEEGAAANLVLCLDDSGSMHKKQSARNQAAIDLTEKLSDQVNLGAVYFQYQITTVMELQNLKDGDKRKELQEAFDSELHGEEHGNTNVGEALNYAISMLKDAEKKSEKKLPSVIFLFTDGKNDFLDDDGERIEDYVEEANELTREVASKAKEAGIVIHTICLNEKDIELLKEVSRMTGGTYKRIGSIGKLSETLLSMASPYTKQKRRGGEIIMALFIVLVIVGIGGVAAYYFRSFKKQEYLMDYQVDRMKDEIDQRNKREELDIQIREEQKNKKFYVDVILTHGNAIGGRSCFDNEGRRRGGILSIGDIIMIGRNPRGEDYSYRIDEAGLELWATFDENELILRSKKTPFEIRKEGTARDLGDRTQKATIKCNQQYYIVLGSKHEIGLLTTRGI